MRHKATYKQDKDKTWSVTCSCDLGLDRIKIKTKELAEIAFQTHKVYMNKK